MAQYQITIKAKGEKKKKDSPIAGDNKKSDTEKSKGLLSKEDAKAFAAGMVAYGTVKSFATQILNHEVSLVQLRRGSNELQERANFINQMAQKGLGIMESVVGGALVGGVGGALVGLTLSATHEAISIAQKQQTIELNNTIENIGLNMNVIRAGANGSRRNE